ncbi:PREDICTED: uncharacterized protein LOC109166206 [Ipomoea nil]|uniref:uncharacterized protein LOC109166206 n=1 Tax=Ipomoea nil TaxID=35883 RepID=UPI00090161A5|nr:PREDICTED: uncharacterized protein LOC109166206 [Ipomoea nil]
MTPEDTPWRPGIPDWAHTQKRISADSTEAVSVEIIPPAVQSPTPTFVASPGTSLSNIVDYRQPTLVGVATPVPTPVPTLVPTPVPTPIPTPIPIPSTASTSSSPTIPQSGQHVGQSVSDSQPVTTSEISQQ